MFIMEKKNNYFFNQTRIKQIGLFLMLVPKKVVTVKSTLKVRIEAMWTTRNI